jgi:uncharacterized RDD family membrane protein YckC
MTQAAAGNGRVLHQNYAISSVERRLAAWLIDFVMLLIAVAAIAALFGAWHSSTSTLVQADGSTFTDTTFYPDRLWSESLLAILSAIYMIPLWTVWGATLGQRMLGMRVVGTGEPKPLPLHRAALRWAVLFGWTLLAIAAYFIGELSLVSFIWLVALLVAVVRDSRTQGLHDRAAGSFVVDGRIR